MSPAAAGAASRSRRRPAAIFLGATVFLGLFGPGSTATAAPVPTAVVAPPNATTTGFVSEVLAIPRGGSLDILVADTTAHNLACAKKTKKRPRRPVCASEYAIAGETARVEGVEKLKPGTHALLCQLHPQMTVELTVLDTP
jgi:hypothetical protein